MDIFIKSLSINTNLKVKDVVYPCFKILDWLEINLRPQLLYTYKDIETFIKAASYIDECSRIFGGYLHQTLEERYPFHKHMIEKYFQHFKERGCIHYVCTNIIEVNNGVKYIYAVENILNCREEKVEVDNIIKSITSSNSLSTKDLSKNRKKLYTIVQRLLHLPAIEINDAFDRILDNINFNVIGLIFLESDSSPYFDKCILLEEKICQKISSFQMSEYFFRSMFLTASTSGKGMQFYCNCLQNQLFADSLIKYYIAYLSDNNKDFEVSSDHILFLVWSSLHNKSACRNYFYNKLIKCNTSIRVLNLINKLNFIYN